jgi:signal-transduction protein with cAMP-binding, CBS, and nucleotidyltransferase domain
MTIDRCSLKDTRVSDLLGGEVVCIPRDASIQAAALALDGACVGAVVVGDLADVAGIVSERDIVGAVAHRRVLETTTAVSIASTDIVKCEPGATVSEVALEMMDRYVRHVLVEDQGKFIGIVSARDLLAVFVSGELQ